jgi:hypothetical protein
VHLASGVDAQRFDRIQGSAIAETKPRFCPTVQPGRPRLADLVEDLRI